MAQEPGISIEGTIFPPRYQIIILGSVSRSVALGPEASAPPGSLLEMHIPRSHPDLQSQSLGVEPSNRCFNKPVKWFQYKLKFRKLV